MEISRNELALYVSIDGDDFNKGTLESPLRTLDKAVQLIKQLNINMDWDICVYVREGVYYLEKPLEISFTDSIFSDINISFKALTNENPVLSGAIKITGNWSNYKNGIMMCRIKDYNEKYHNFNQLFVNGKCQVLARYPKACSCNEDENSYIYPQKSELDWPHTYLKFNPETFSKKRWCHPEEGVIHIFPTNYWGSLQWKIENIDYEDNIIYFGKGGFQINDIMQGRDATGIDHRSKYYIENIFEELDTPGEWYLDKRNGILYVMPEKDVDLNSALVEAPILENIISLKGDQYNPVKNISFNGIKITHTKTTFLKEYEAPSLGDWSIHRGGAVFFEGAEECSLENCTFDSIGGNALFINNYNKKIKICGNTFTNCGDSGICIVGSKYLTMGTNHAYPSENVIFNNLIHDIGKIGKQTAGVFISISKDNIVSHNHIYNVPRAAICINDGTWGGHIIEFNEIHDTCRETGDHGPFNSWGRDRFWCLEQSHGPCSHGAGNVKLDAQKVTIIRNNRFKDNKGWGIDLDDGSSNYHIYNNICIGIGIKLREGDYRIVENNIFVDCANPPGFHIGYENNHDKFIRNIIYMNSKYDRPEIDIDFNKGYSKGRIYEIIGPPVNGAIMEECDYNLFFNDIGEFLATIHYRPLGSKSCDYSFDEWKKLNMDLHSIFEDPLFVDYINGDYRLLPQSPVFNNGFKEFDLNSIGLLTN